MKLLGSFLCIYCVFVRKPSITSLSIGVCKFEDNLDVESMQITEFFKPVSTKNTEEDKTPKKLDIATNNNNHQQSSANKSNKKESFFEKYMRERESAKKQLEEEKSRDSTTSSCQKVIQQKVLHNIVSDEETPTTSTNHKLVDKEIKNNDRDTPQSTGSAGSDDLFEKCREKSNRSHTVPQQEVPEIWLDLPKSRGDIDDETWRDLPPDIRFELTQEFRKQQSNSKGNIASKNSPNKRPGKKPNSSKSPARKSKKNSSNSSFVNGTTLYDYYNKL